MRRSQSYAAMSKTEYALSCFGLTGRNSPRPRARPQEKLPAPFPVQMPTASCGAQSSGVYFTRAIFWTLTWSPVRAS